jgi:hypothetical protein
MEPFSPVRPLPSSPLSGLSNSELADRIVTWSGRVAAGEAELTALVGEFDRREAWGGTGLLSCAHWLAWRTGLSPTAAREKVRVARALRELPQVREGLASGRLSYSQVRAITRVATVEDQERWVDAARSATAGQLERLVRGVRRVRAVEEAEADPERAQWKLRATKSFDDDGNAVYRIVLPAEEAAVVDAALEVARAELDRQAADTFAASASSTGRRASGGGRFRGSASSTGDARRRTGRDGPQRAHRGRRRCTGGRSAVTGEARGAGRPAHRLGPAGRR